LLASTHIIDVLSARISLTGANPRTNPAGYQDSGLAAPIDNCRAGRILKRLLEDGPPKRDLPQYSTDIQSNLILDFSQLIESVTVPEPGRAKDD